MNLFKLTLATGLFALFSLTACADDEEGSSSGGSGGSTSTGDSTGTGQPTGSNVTASCCIDGAFFDCGSDVSAAETCFTDRDASGCSADPSRDLDCD